MKLRNKLWNWGHLAGCHNVIVPFDCRMGPVEFAKEYGIPNAFIVSYAGNIQPPFDATAKQLGGLSRVIWSVLGDASTPLPEAELGNTEDILAMTEPPFELVGGVVDDFFSPARLERFTPEVLMNIKKRLNSRGLSFWCVLYSHQLDALPLENYVDCFDGFTFWIWECANIPYMDEYYANLRKIIGDKPTMLGVYLMDYSKPMTEMDPILFERQLKNHFERLRKQEIEGIIFCSNTVGDAPTDANRILKEYLAAYGDIEI